MTSLVLVPEILCCFNIRIMSSINFVNVNIRIGLQITIHHIKSSKRFVGLVIVLCGTILSCFYSLITFNITHLASLFYATIIYSHLLVLLQDSEKEMIVEVTTTGNNYLSELISQ